MCQRIGGGRLISRVGTYIIISISAINWVPVVTEYTSENTTWINTILKVMAGKCINIP